MSEKIKCQYCGNNPVNHTMSYIVQSLSVLLEPIGTKIFSGRQHKWVKKVGQKIMKPYVFLSEKGGMMHFSKNIALAKTERSRVIWQEAKNRGIYMEQMIIFGKAVEQYRAKINGVDWEYFESLPIPPYMEQDAYIWMDDKSTLKKVFIKNGIPVANGGSARTWEQALKIFNKLEKPVIVKPRVGSRGRHTTTFINNEEALLHGFDIAKKLCAFVMIEEHLMGSVYRATLVDGKLVGFLAGEQPKIVGDGLQTIAQLVSHNSKIKVNEEFVVRQGLTMESVLSFGQVLELSEKIGLAYGGNAIEMLQQIHPKLKQIIENTHKFINVPVVGYDIIIPDATVDPDIQKWGFIEANSLPFINLHHTPAEGEPVNVAGFIWDLWKE